MLRRIATAIVLVAIAHGPLHAEEQKSCKTETGNYTVKKDGKTYNCLAKSVCTITVVEGRCREFFGCKTYFTTEYSGCKVAAQTAPPAKVLPKITPEGAETPATKNPKVVPRNGIKRG